MPRFLRIQNTVIHIPSVSNVSMGSNCLGKPYLAITFHPTEKTTFLYYGTWETCELHFNAVKTAMKEIDTLLASVSLTDSEPVLPPIQKETNEMEEERKKVVTRAEEFVKTLETKKGEEGASSD
jgi:hypothetical protein